MFLSYFNFMFALKEILKKKKKKKEEKEMKAQHEERTLFYLIPYLVSNFPNLPYAMVNNYFLFLAFPLFFLLFFSPFSFSCFPILIKYLLKISSSSLVSIFPFFFYLFYFSVLLSTYLTFFFYLIFFFFCAFLFLPLLFSIWY